MRTIAKTVALAVVIASLGGNALADGRYGMDHGYHGHGHGADWVAPLLFLGIAGAVIGAAASQSNPPPQPVYVAPPVTYVPPSPVYVAPPVTYVPAAPVYAQPEVVAPPPPPVNAWYFCRSVGQYYPYTQHCPEGWQLVTPPQR